MFVLSGLLAALAALLHAALVNQGSHIDGNGYELNAIAAVVIGGTSLAGGVGTVVGSMIGALTLSMLDNILGLRNIQSEYQAILKGVIIVLAVFVQRQRRESRGAAAQPSVALTPMASALERCPPSHQRHSGRDRDDTQESSACGSLTPAAVYRPRTEEGR